MEVSKIDISSDINDKQLSQFKEAPNFSKLFGIYEKELSELQDVLFEILESKNLDTATGYALDLIGKIVGERREGKSDDEYRKALRLRISINTSDGTPNIIIGITSEYAGGSDTSIVEHEPASFFIHIDGKENVDWTLESLVNEIRAAAVKSTVTTSYGESVFRPAWLTSTTKTDQFQVNDGVTPEDFLVFTGGVLDTFSIQFGAENYDEGTNDNSILGWIPSTTLELYDGDDFNLNNNALLTIISSTAAFDGVSLAQVVTDYSKEVI